jgi:hypothetical protein
MARLTALLVLAACGVFGMAQAQPTTGGTASPVRALA